MGWDGTEGITTIPINTKGKKKPHTESRTITGTRTRRTQQRGGGMGGTIGTLYGDQQARQASNKSINKHR